MTDEVKAELWYPRNEENAERVRVNLVDVRAADSLLIEYDFDRDGWSVQQEPVRRDGYCMKVVGPPEEVAFVSAWNMTEGSEKGE